MSKTIDQIEEARSALRDIYGLIPEKDRHYATDNVTTIEGLIYKLHCALRYKRQVEAATKGFDEELK